MTAARPLVVGLGNLHGGDDAVGLEVAAAVAALDLSDVDVVEHADPTDLLELWEGRQHVVVVDALLAGAEPGAVLAIEAGQGEPPLSSRPTGWTASGGTHAFGLSDAVDLARSLDRLPPRLTVVGVVAQGFRALSPLSETVRAAIPAATDCVTRAIRPGPTTSGESYHVPG